MRIIAGRHRGRRLKAPPGRDVRPTSDRTRESLFNLLLHGQGLDLEGATVIDAFAGSGALGLEALSRGAAFAVFLDNDPQALRCVRENADSLGERARALVLRVDATRMPPPPASLPAPARLVFLDPPYGTGFASLALEGLAARGWLAAEALVAVEVGAREPFQPSLPFRRLDERTYGAARVILAGFESS